MGVFGESIRKASGNPTDRTDSCMLSVQSNSEQIIDYVVQYLDENAAFTKVLLSGGYVLKKAAPYEYEGNLKSLDLILRDWRYYERLVPIFREVGNIIVSHGVADYSVVQPQLFDKHMVALDCVSSNTGVPNVRVRTLDDLSYGVHSIDINGISVPALTPTRQLSESLIGVLNPSTDSMDLAQHMQDIWFMSGSFDVDMTELHNMINVSECIMPIHDVNYKGRIDQCRAYYDSLKIMMEIQTTTAKAHFEAVVDRLYMLLQNMENGGKWNHHSCCIE